MANFLIGKGLMLAAVAVVLTIAMSSCQIANNSTLAGYQRISPGEANEIMLSEVGYIILDVRTEEEYAQGHVPGAILLPDYEIETRAEEVLPNKDQLILVYCRSGRRSKAAAEALIELGYTNVKDFGGIIDWEYDIEK